MSASLFGTGNAVNVNVDGSLIPQSFVGTASQTVFNLTAFTYTPGTNSLLVFINGQRQILGRDFIETSSSVFTLTEGVIAGDYVDVIGFPSTTLSSTVAGGVSFTQRGVGAIPQTLQTKEEQSICVFDFFTDAQIADCRAGTQLTDLSVAIQKAIDSVCPVIGGYNLTGSVFFPAGVYRVDSVINCTNSRVGGTLNRDGLRLCGESMTGTKFLGRAGAGRAVFETTGSQWLTLENFYIGQSTANKSTVGIYQGLSIALPQTQNQEFRRLYIDMGTDNTANGGVGTIGIWNFGAEEATYHTCYIDCVFPVFLTATRPSTNLGISYAYSYQAQAGSHSLGVTTFSGENFLLSRGRYMPSVVMEDINSIDFGNIYMSNSGAGGANDAAVRVYGSIFGGSWNGTVEAHGTAFDVYGALGQFNARITFGGITNAAAPRINLRRGGGGIISGCKMQFNEAATPARPLFANTPSAPSEIVSCYIQNSEFITNSDRQYCTIPENVKWNPLTAGVTILAQGAGATIGYKAIIDQNLDVVNIPPKTCLINAGITQAEVVRINLPTITGSNNSLALSLHLKGMLFIPGAGSNSQSVRYIDTHVNVGLSQLGVVTLSAANADQTFAFTNANVNAGGNNITAGVVNPINNVTHVSIFVTPTRTGANLENVMFTGTAELRWYGNESRAPSLAVV